MKTQSPWYRYIQLGVLVLGSGSIYPLVYLRQNFELSLLESLAIDAAQLGQCYSLLGVMFVLTYIPSGWLADRIAPRYLITFSLLGSAVLGLWFSSYPSYAALQFIFLGWGLTTGLTLWAALIKSVAMLAEHNEQGRFFGILDGGRGLVEAIVATIAVVLFAAMLNDQQDNIASSLKAVIIMYIGFMLLMAPLIFIFLSESDVSQAQRTSNKAKAPLWPAVKQLFGNKHLWMCSLCLLCGYQLFWATYSFSAYIQSSMGLTAVAVGSITVAKLWMRPIGAICAGFIGDRWQCERVLMWLMLLGTLSLIGLIFLPTGTAVSVIVATVLLIGLLTYAIRGLYWSTLDACQIPASIKGMAIGFMSFVGYAPDIYLPWLNGFLLQQFPGVVGYNIYFAIIAASGFLGVFVARWLMLHTDFQRRSR